MTVATCPFCRRELSDDMAVMVDLEGNLQLVCFVCLGRAEEAATYGDDPEEETTASTLAAATDRIVAAVKSLDLSVNVTTTNAHTTDEEPRDVE